MQKRILSLLLALVLVFGLLPVTASANELDNGLQYEVYGDHVEITEYTGDASEVVIPAEIEGLPVTAIDDFAFYDCSSLTDIAIPGSVTYIGKAAFCWCVNLTNIVIPDTVTFISVSAFSHCTNLTSVYLPDSITYIGDDAFKNCESLTRIVIPSSVTKIGERAFSECYELRSVNIPNGITYISPELFYMCHKLTSIHLPDSVTTIGYRAFSECYALTSINIPNSVTEIEMAAFRACLELPCIDIPSSISIIRSSTFSGCESLTNIVIPNSVTAIYDFAFFGCSGLTSITIPSSVVEIREASFAGCSSLTEIHVDENNPNYTSDDRGVLFDKEKTMLLQAPGGIMGSYTIPDSTVTIATCAFSGCEKLTDISIPDSVTNIEKRAFEQCYSLNSIIIPESVSVINEDTFCSCENLTSIVIPASVTSIDDGAFAICENLIAIRFDGDAPKFARSIFSFTEATAYYPSNNDSWTEDVMQRYGGKITWSAYDPNHSHEYKSIITAPTCIYRGFTTIICTKCGIGHPEEYVDALGHDYVDGFCTRCYEDDPNYETPVENPFTDVPAGCWYEAPVLWALENGITTGTSDTTFSPGDKCLRAHVVTFLWNAEKCPEPAAAASTFTDVPTGAWYEKPVLWAVENGITSGTSATKFGAGDVCSRYQVVFFLWKAAGSPEPKTTVNPFTDVNPGHFFYKAVLWAVENGITSGTSATTFGPTVPCNRAQVVTFLYAAYN